MQFTAGGTDVDGKTYSDVFTDQDMAVKYMEELCVNEIMESVFLIKWSDEGDETLLDTTAAEFLMAL
jgi:hypothetical protein